MTKRMVRLVADDTEQDIGQFWMANIPRPGDELRIRETRYTVQRTVWNFDNNREGVELYVKQW